MPEQTSIWKKEIHLGRRSRLDDVVEAATEATTKAELQAAPAPAVNKQSIWKKEFHLGSAPGDHPSIWKKEIRLLPSRKPAAESPAAEQQAPVPAPEPAATHTWATAKREELWVAPEPEAAVVEVATTAGEEGTHAPTPEPEAFEQATPEPEPSVKPSPSVEPEKQRPHAEETASAPKLGPLDPKFRKLNLLRRLVERRAEEFPEREDEWRVFLARLEATAVKGVLAPDFDSVVSTLFRDLLRAHPKPPKRFPRRSSKPKPERAPKQPSQSFWKKELSFGSRAKPKAEGAASEPKAPKPPLLKRELHLPRPKLPFLGRAPADRETAVVKLVGLRIGSSQLAAALVDNNGSAELLQLARTPLRRGIVASGEVRDSVALAEALKRFFAQHKLPRRAVRLGVATNRIGVRVIEVPAMDDPRLFGNAIRFRAQEVLPIPLAEAVLDYVVLGDADEARGAKHHRVLLVFAHRELVDGYLDACRRAGLKLVGIDFDAFALLRALARNPGDAAERRGALVAVAIGHERTIFAVSDGAVCDFARVIEWGGASLDAALARALDITAEEAEQVKKTLSLTGDPATGELSADRLEAADGALREELQALTRELVSSLQFYQSRSGSLDIGEVLLTGGGAQLPGIDTELGRQLGVPVRMGDPLGRVTMGKNVDRPADAGSLAIAVGLGIEA